jgi:hypothetical protein
VKKVFIGEALLVFSFVTTFGSDGYITFANFNNPAVIQFGGNPLNTRPLDQTYSVGLFVGNRTGNINATPIAVTTIFEDTGLFQFNGPDIALPGTTPGQPAILTVKAWKGANFAAGFGGEVSFTSLPLGGINPNPPPPALTAPDLSNMPVLRVIILSPEPPPYLLALVGIAALAISRRKTFAV